jgi:hypothetical protein
MASPFKSNLTLGRSKGGKLPKRQLGGSPRTASTGSQGAGHAEANMERGRNIAAPHLPPGPHGGTKGHGPGGDTSGGPPTRRSLTPPNKPGQGSEKIDSVGKTN